MLTKGEELAVEILSAAFEGKAVARHEGRVIFIDHAVPGDLLIAKVYKIKKSYAEAKIVRIERPSKLRVDPPCKYFGVCGGCTWQNLDYQAQLEFKQQQVRDAFERIGGFSDLHILPIIGADDIFYYRGKMEYSFSTQQWLVLPPEKTGDAKNISEKNNTAGFSEEQSFPVSSHSIFLGLHVPQRYDKVLDIDGCHLQSSLSNQVLNFTREFARQHNLVVYDSETETGFLRFLVIRESKRTKESMVNLVTFSSDDELLRQYTSELLRVCPGVTTVVNTINSRKAQIAFGETEKIYYGNGTIQEIMGKYHFTISASSFFQTNVAQAEKLYQVTREFGEFSMSDVVYDLYCGTGSIAMHISDAVKEVVGIESVESALQDAEKNVRENNITNCRFILGDLKDRLTKDKEWMKSHPNPDALVIDPPRSGMHLKVVDEIISLAPRRIVYVSCNPATQARDIRLLCADKYQLVKLQPVDMFPHTYHIENVALLHVKA